jgi:hypothetical protein
VLGEVRPLILAILQLLINLLFLGGMEGCFPDGQRITTRVSSRLTENSERYSRYNTDGPQVDLLIVPLSSPLQNLWR